MESTRARHGHLTLPSQRELATPILAVSGWSVRPRLAAVDLTMGLSPTRPFEVIWDASPEAVASELSRAIAEQRYEDAGDATKVAWRAAGRIDGRSLDCS